MTRGGFKHRALHTLQIQQRMQLFRLVQGNFVEVRVESVGFRSLYPQLMYPIIGASEVNRSSVVETAGLPGFFLQIFVNTHGVVLESGNIVIVMQPMCIRCRMPGGTGSQLIALEQHDVGPAKLGEMIKNTAAD